MAFVFFFNDTATTEIYTLSLHDALPISSRERYPTRRRSKRFIGIAMTPRIVPNAVGAINPAYWRKERSAAKRAFRDRKSTRLNSSHGYISYAVFCLKKKSMSAGRVGLED